MGGGMGGDAPMRPFFTYGSGRPDRDTDAPPAPMQGGFLRHILASVFGGAPMGDNGQFGDYVLNNEALDQIISNLMEQSNGNRPVPAPEDMVDKLPRIVVTPGSPLLSKECAVCKEDFSLTDALPPDSTSDSSSSTSQPTSSDATETQPSVVVTLPCPGAHAFHEDCILPWLKSSGTCPVCRYELVPQPKHQGPPGGPNEGGSDTVPNAGVRANSEAPQRLPGAWEDLD
jgi:E3 ubiquitin-protein ligase RNF115/126